MYVRGNTSRSGSEFSGAASVRALEFCQSQVLPRPCRVGDSLFQQRGNGENHSNLQCSSSQRGSAVHDSQIGRSTKTIVIYSVPAPREGLQFIIPKSRAAPKPL